MPTNQEVIDLALTQMGKPYIFGYEVGLSDPNPRAFDCSELVEWVCAQLGVEPRMPDGTWGQEAHCQRHGTTIPLEEAYNTPGALLLRHPGDGSGHVAIAVGDGSTSAEAMGTAYGCKIGLNVRNRGWTYAALIPGVDYGPAHATIPNYTPAAPAAPAEPVDLNLIAAIDTAVRATVYNGAPIRQGSADTQAVKCIQWMLNVEGMNVEVDGDFGPQTEFAVKVFQRAKGRKDSGIVGRVVWVMVGLKPD